MSRLSRALRRFATSDLPASYLAYEAAAQAMAAAKVGRPTYPERDPEIMAREQTKIGLIARCARLVSHAAGVAPLKVYDESRDDEEIPDHPLRQLMRRPNPEMGPARFIGTVALRGSLAGWCVIEKERNRLGEVIALWPMRPEWLRAVPLNNSAPAWDYHVPGIARPFRLQPNDVIAFTWDDRFDGSPYGLGALEPAIREVALLNKMTDFLNILFERGGVPLYGLIAETMGERLSPAQVQEIRRRFMEQHGGLENAAIPVVLQSIKDVKRLSMDMNELALTAIRDLSDLAITQAFGVPPRKAGTRVGLEHTTQNATASVEDGEFYRDTLVPFWTRFDEALTLGLLSEPQFRATPTINLAFDLSAVQALQEDQNQRRDQLRGAVREGSVTPNELRAELGLPALRPEVGDVLYIPLFLSPINLAGQPRPAVSPAAAPTTEPPPAQLASGRRVRALTSPNGHEGYAKRATIAASNRALIARVAGRAKPILAAFFEGQGERVLAEMDTLAVRAAQELLIGDRAAYWKVVIHRDVLKRARTERLNLSNVDWVIENSLLTDALRGLYLLAGDQAFAATTAQLGLSGLSFDLANPRTKQVVDRLATRVTGITETSRSLIAQTVTQALDDGLGIEGIRDRLTSLFAGWTDARAEMIARTESMVAYGEASILSYRESGIVDRGQVFDNPGHTDDYGATDGLTCATRDGTVWPLDEVLDHIYADHPNGSAVAAPVLTGEEV